MDAASKYEVKEHQNHVPSLEELSNLFNEKLKSFFKNVAVAVEECPDLSLPPFHLTQKGLNGHPSVADVGGVPNLVPLAKVSKDGYHIPEIIKILGYKDGASAIGAAAGPHHLLGVNCEGMPNISVGVSKDNNHEIRNETRIAKLDESQEKGYKLISLSGKVGVLETSFALLGNLFISEGKPGKILKICVKTRIIPEESNFIGILRKILSDAYQDKVISMGGVFLIKSGSAKIHIMPDFSKTPLNSDAEVNEWLKYFVVDTENVDGANCPLICLTTFHSKDPNLDLRVEHTHCFNLKGDGGHYHYDTTPDIVEYEGYFMVAEKIFRVDAPKETHMIGRD